MNHCFTLSTIKQRFVHYKSYRLNQPSGHVLAISTISVSTISQIKVRLGLNNAICLTDSFVFMPGHCMNLKVIRYESNKFK